MNVLLHVFETKNVLEKILFTASQFNGNRLRLLPELVLDLLIEVGVLLTQDLLAIIGILKFHRAQLVHEIAQRVANAGPGHTLGGLDSVDSLIIEE